MIEEQQRYRERPSRLPGAVVWTWDAPDHPLREPHSVLPDGCMDLIWSDGRIVVAGPDTHAFEVEPPNRVPSAAIRFAPGTAPVLLGVPASLLRDHRADLADLWPSAAVRRLTERIDEAPDPAEALERFALDRIADTGPPDPRTVAVAEGLRRGRSVAATAAEAGLGARQLHRRSLAAFGYGPKTLARILRLQRALELIRTGLPYAEAACAAGCTDQAHLAREMRDLAGTTLGAYFASAAANSETPLPSGSSTTA
ncbi:helix-turn-helix domain-containing protein [Streptomyces sp. NPDC012389]|uniref:helix-turn-helix domain-containing protein n=1 Tax=unclassified Streptomyces TaxID=2593676 RepID=UPI00081E9B2F|nr:MULTISPECIES: helix-turn-helix domain-containing protein [unclassified Streptomyces]MYR96864.1 helix-turn-helix domain-containing protein [Streptomyces sp. SID4937]SCE17455.1 transcriptional regulator, AraC family [Streptomyces sp. ScaeMP-e83]